MYKVNAEKEMVLKKGRALGLEKGAQKKKVATNKEKKRRRQTS